MATLPKVLINRADYQIGGGVALRLRTQAAVTRIRWKQQADGFADLGMTFGNPDFVAYARAYGAKGTFVEAADGLTPALQSAFREGGVHLIAAPIDCTENKRVLIDELGRCGFTCPIPRPSDLRLKHISRCLRRVLDDLDHYLQLIRLEPDHRLIGLPLLGEEEESRCDRFGHTVFGSPLRPDGKLKSSCMAELISALHTGSSCDRHERQAYAVD